MLVFKLREENSKYSAWAESLFHQVMAVPDPIFSFYRDQYTKLKRAFIIHDEGFDAQNPDPQLEEVIASYVPSDKAIWLNIRSFAVPGYFSMANFTLLEEMVHGVDHHYSFSIGEPWLKAVKQDLEEKNPLRAQLFQDIREVMKVGNITKAPLSDYTKRTKKEFSEELAKESWKSIILHTLIGTATRVANIITAKEYLVDLIICKFLLTGAPNTTPDVVETIMHRAFPHTYPLVKEFEQFLAQHEGPPMDFWKTVTMKPVQPQAVQR